MSVLTKIFSLLGGLCVAAFSAIGAALARLFTTAERWLVERKHAQYGLAVTRILLGLTGLGLLLTNLPTHLYTFGAGAIWNGQATDPTSGLLDVWAFQLFRTLADQPVLFTIGYALVMVLSILIVVGYRMKIVLPLFLAGYVGIIELADAVGDQGDNAYRIVLFLLLFADTSQRWSLDARRRARYEGTRLSPVARAVRGVPFVPEWLTNTLHNLTLIAVGAQVIFIYGAGGLYKAEGEPWQSGDAIWAPLHTERFGPWPWLTDLVTASPAIMTIAAWGSILLQVGFGFMMLNRYTRVLGLIGILGFHISIAVLMGLPWFSLAMIAVDAIFIRDERWRSIANAVTTRWRALGSTPAAADDASAHDETVAPAHEQRASLRSRRAAAQQMPAGDTIES